MQKIKPLLFHLLNIVILYLATAVFFGPLFQGKKLSQADIISSESKMREILDYRRETGERVYWNNTMFAGMPEVTDYGRGENLTGKVFGFFDFGMPRPANFIFKAMLFGYFAFILLGISPWLSLLGALGYGLTTHSLVITEAGHNSKIACLSLFPLIMAGFLLVFRKKYLVGGVVITLATAMAIYTRHPQMMYYLFMSLVVGGVAFFVHYLREKQLMEFLKSTAILLVAAVWALVSGYSHISSMQNYSKDSMRGDPILKQEASAVQTGSSSEVEGLAWEYAMQWSNGVMDLWSSLIPGVAGGSSAEPVDQDDASVRLFQNPRNARAPLYWGDLPFTSGPPYFGAVIVLLFVFGLFFLPGHMRWWAIISVVMMLLLSMGDNFSMLNRPLFDHLPLYNKFRAPASILVVASGIMIFFAVLGTDRLFKLTKKERQQAVRKLIYVGGGLGAICLFFALIGPATFDFRSAGDARYQQQVLELFMQDRKALMRQDAWRTFLFVAMSAGLLWAFLTEKLNALTVSIGLAVLTLADFWGIDRRYVNDESFVSKKRYEQNFTPRPVDQQILQREPKGRGFYRVLDLSINTFNSASTSYFHNTIGGYSPVKLQRIQDVIDRHISRNNQSVLNMLNTKYIIGQDGQLTENPNALGNAWFVEDIIPVNSPNEEIDALNDFDPASQAVILEDEFSNYLEGFNVGNGQGTIELVNYEPHTLTYQTNTSQDQLAVFSEIWYGPGKGWTVTLDGEPVEHIRANYLLRAMKVPAGQHTIYFEFDPDTVYKTKNLISRIASTVILLLTLAMAGLYGWKWYQKPAPAPEKKPAKKAKTKKTSTSSGRKGKRKK